MKAQSPLPRCRAPELLSWGGRLSPPLPLYPLAGALLLGQTPCPLLWAHGAGGGGSPLRCTVEGPCGLAVPVPCHLSLAAGRSPLIELVLRPGPALALLLPPREPSWWPSEGGAHGVPEGRGGEGSELATPEHLPSPVGVTPPPTAVEPQHRHTGSSRGTGRRTRTAGGGRGTCVFQHSSLWNWSFCSTLVLKSSFLSPDPRSGRVGGAVALVPLPPPRGKWCRSRRWLSQQAPAATIGPVPPERAVTPGPWVASGSIHPGLAAG